MKPNVVGNTFVDEEASLIHHAATITSSRILPRINERFISGKFVMGDTEFPTESVWARPEVQAAGREAADEYIREPRQQHLRLPLEHDQVEVALKALHQAYRERLLYRGERKPARNLLVEAGVIQPRAIDRVASWAGQVASRVLARATQDKVTFWY